MTTLPLFLAALVSSLVGIGYLLVTDSKRRRARGIRHVARLRQIKTLGWAAVVSPGLLLLLNGEASVFLAWFGSLTVCAWLIVSWAGIAARWSLPKARGVR